MVDMVKIAYCLYGQPRNIEKGYKNISTFVEKHEVDFYYHTWTLSNDETYSHSNYRKIDVQELAYDKNILEKINALYQPKAYLAEPSKTFRYENIESSLAFVNTSDVNKVAPRISNTLSQIYSRQQVRNLLMYVVQNEPLHYDLVITSRFDMLREINISLDNLDCRKIYVSNYHKPRYIFQDSLFILGMDGYFKMFNIFNNLLYLIDNKKLNTRVNEYREKLMLVPESLIFANYIYYYSNLDHVEYINIPNFI